MNTNFQIALRRRNWLKVTMTRNSETKLILVAYNYCMMTGVRGSTGVTRETRVEEETKKEEEKKKEDEEAKMI